MPNVTVITQSGNGTAITLPQYNEITYGSQNEVVFSWTAITDNVFYDVQPAIAKNVQVVRNRAGTYVAVIDPGVEPVRMQWTEYQFSGNQNIPITKDEYGVLSVAGTTFRNLTESVTITLYRVHYVYVRATNESYDLTAFMI